MVKVPFNSVRDIISHASSIDEAREILDGFELQSRNSIVFAEGNTNRAVTPLSWLCCDVHDFEFKTSEGGWQKEKEEDLTPAEGWKVASVALVGWKVQFTNGDHHIAELEVIPWITAHDPPSLLKVKCRIGFRDDNGDDPWRGYARVRIDYYG